MMDPFRAEILTLGELCSKPPEVAEFILTNPKTSIRSFGISDFLFTSTPSAEAILGGHLANLLCTFLQANQNLERVVLNSNLNRNSRVTELSNIQIGMWTLSLSKNPTIKVLEVVLFSLNDTNILDATHVLQPLSSSSSSMKISLSLGQSGVIVDGENFWHFASTISELRGLHSLVKGRSMHPMLFSGILNTMKKSKFSLLQKLEVNDTCTETLKTVGCFLDSRAAPSLKKIDLGRIKKQEQASMELLVQGLKKSDSVQTLKFFPHHLGQMAAEVFAKYIAEAPPSLRNLVLWKNESGCHDMLATINAALCSNPNIKELALHDFGHQEAYLVKELLLKTQSLKSLEILGSGDNSDLSAKLVEGLKSNATLTSLVIQGLRTSLSVRPLVEALEQRSISLKTLKLSCNNDTQKLLVPTICDWLRNPLCALEDLSLACKINHAEVLPLLLNGDTSKTLVKLRLFCELQGLNLSTEMGWKMVSILPKMKLEQLSVYFVFHSGTRYEYDEEAAMNIRKAVESKMVQNHQLENLEVRIFPNWRVSRLPKELQIRNKSIKVAKSLQDNKIIPLALVPLMMKKIENKCQYLPKMANYDSLSSTLIYSMLRARPRSDMMNSVKSYFLPQDDQEGSNQL